MRPGAKLAIVALVAILLPTQGCLVTRGKYNKLQTDRDRMVQLLEEREGELTAAQDSFRKRLENVTQELDLYKKQATASKGDAEKIRAQLEASKRQSKDFQDQIRALGIGKVRDGRLVLQDTLLFRLGEAVLSSEGRRALDKVAAAFRGKDVLIQIDGHTDTTRIAKTRTKQLHVDNMGLSAHRALAVFRHLRSKGLRESNMYIRGFGSSWPVASNATAVSKARNRRVEILFIPTSLVKRTRAR